MCRWIAYSGEPIFIEQIVTLPKHSLVEQSINAEMNYNAEGALLSVNADGFGVGWYGEREDPGLFRDATPAWSDENLRQICHQIKSGLFFSHVRARTTGPVQKTNCHPFKYKNWLFQHNGGVNNFEVMRQDLNEDIAPALYLHLKGTTDSETIFLLALTYGLMDDPQKAMEKVVKRLRQAADDQNVKFIMNLSCSISNGDKIWTVRYSENEPPMTQFYSKKSDWVCDESGNKISQPKSIILVSEPIDKMNREWIEIPQNSFTETKGNKITIEKFIDE